MKITTKFLLFFSIIIFSCLTFAQPQYAPYKDFLINAGEQPEDLVQTSQASGIKHFRLGFIVSNNQCEATWGGQETLPWGNTTISHFQQSGGDVVITFGGQIGTYLSKACTDVSSLVNEYNKVIQAYNVHNLDFDVEGAAIADPDATARMISAIAQLQQSDPNLTIDFTLPVLPQGLTQDGVNLIQKAINAGVNIRYVNMMAMDYGSYAAPDPAQMGQYAIQAANAVSKQLQTLYPNKSNDDIWKMIGMTPMIGINDVWHYDLKPAQPERFTIDDANKVITFAKHTGMQLISNWSVNRDRPCDQQYASPICSGAFDGTRMQDTDYQFAKTLEAFERKTEKPK